MITCLQELAGFGITEAEIGSHMTAHPNLKTRGRLWFGGCETNITRKTNICDNNRTGVLWYNSYKSVNALTASTWYRGWNMCSGQCRAHCARDKKRGWKLTNTIGDFKSYSILIWFCEFNLNILSTSRRCPWLPKGWLEWCSCPLLPTTSTWSKHQSAAGGTESMRDWS